MEIVLGLLLAVVIFCLVLAYLNKEIEKAARPRPVMCPCGKPSDGWPGNVGEKLCQMCWENLCADEWWASMTPPPAPGAQRRVHQVFKERKG